MRVLDLFCGGGGASYGYVLAGFEVTGIDVVRRRTLPPTDAFELYQEDVREVLKDVSYLEQFDLVHASPPCQPFTVATNLRGAAGLGKLHDGEEDLLTVTRDTLRVLRVPYVIENVPGAPIRPDLLLCGTMFPELHVRRDGRRRSLRRHRIFELGGLHVPQPNCDHRNSGRPLGVYHRPGLEIPGGGETATMEEARLLIGAPWMNWVCLTEAIPPAYTRYIGSYLT